MSGGYLLQLPVLADPRRAVFRTVRRVGTVRG